ncbi:MAG: hypothetical protein R3B70_31795 [Polyangiaceae bacterium]
MTGNAASRHADGGARPGTGSITSRVFGWGTGSIVSRVLGRGTGSIVSRVLGRGALAAVVAGLALGAAATGAASAGEKDKGAKPAAGNKAAPASKAKGKKKAAPAPLDGTTVDFAYDGKDIGHKERAWLGRAFVHTKAAVDPNKGLPLLVFIHGINSELIRYRWMGGGNEGDVRRIVAELIEGGQVGPMLVAAPSSIVPQNIVVAPTSWMGFDLDHFVDQAAAALKGKATIDRTKIIVAGHSGGGCNVKGGIATAIGAKNVHTALVIDTCMGTDLAKALAGARKSLNVVVTWQALSWGKRPLKDFKTVFEREVKKTPADAGILRTLDYMVPKEGMAHDAMVPLTLKKYLPLLLPPKAASATGTKAE